MRVGRPGAWRYGFPENLLADPDTPETWCRCVMRIRLRVAVQRERADQVLALELAPGREEEKQAPGGGAAELPVTVLTVRPVAARRECSAA